MADSCWQGHEWHAEEPCQLRYWLLELSREQRKAVLLELEHHHDKLFRNLEERLGLLEARLRVQAMADNQDIVTRDTPHRNWADQGHHSSLLEGQISHTHQELPELEFSQLHHQHRGHPSNLSGESATPDVSQLHAGHHAHLPILSGELAKLKPSDMCDGRERPLSGTGSHSSELAVPCSPGPVTVQSPKQLEHRHGSFIRKLKSRQETDSTGSHRRWWQHQWETWHGTFDAAMGIVVIFNVAVIFIQLQTPGTERVYLVVCEHILNVIYILEVSLRIFFGGRDFLKILNLLDMFIVLVTCVDFYLLHRFEGAASSLRLLQIMRVGKTLRVIRTMSQFRHLRVLVGTIASSFSSLLWSMLVLLLCQLTSGLLLCQMLQSYIADPSSDDETREWVDRMYGTSTKAIYTFFEVTFSGGWPSYARPLIENVSPTYAVFFILYITCVNFSITRIISALFLKETLHNAESDADMRIQMSQAERREFVTRLEDLFFAADRDCNNCITYEEFDRLVAYPKVSAWFSSIGVDVRDSKGTFDLLDKNDSGAVEYDEFINGIMRLKGSARSQDIARFIHIAEKILTLSLDTKRTCHALAATVGISKTATSVNTRIGREYHEPCESQRLSM